MMASGMNLITTVLGFGMSAAFIVFVCTRIICGRIRRSQSLQTFEIQPRMDLEQQEQQIGGLEPVVVAAIPTMKFSREAFTSVEDALCCICLGEYEENEVLRIMPNCGHNFHLSCIDLWLRKQSTCPVCRLPLHESLQPKSKSITPSRVGRRMDSPETSMEHSRHWLLPAHEHYFVGLEHDVEQGQLDLVARNQELNAVEADTGQR